MGHEAYILAHLKGTYRTHFSFKPPSSKKLFYSLADVEGVIKLCAYGRMVINSGKEGASRGDEVLVLELLSTSFEDHLKTSKMERQERYAYLEAAVRIRIISETD